MSEIAQLPPGPLSLEQWDALNVDSTRRWELCEGALIMSPFPRLGHQRILKRLIRLLDDHLPPRFEALPEIEVITKATFPPSVRGPDIAVIATGEFAPDVPRVPASQVVLVVEIVSPGSRGMDHVMKLHEYAKAGIENYWIVDPDAPAGDRFVVYRMDAGTYRRVGVLDGDRVRVDDPVAMEFSVDALIGR